MNGSRSLAVVLLSWLVKFDSKFILHTVDREILVLLLIGAGYLMWNYKANIATTGKLHKSTKS